MRAAGLKTPITKHPASFVSPSSSLGKGSQVLAGSVISVLSTIGEACIINTNASVDHECLIGDGVHIAPGATLCGCVTVERFSMIGAGAVVLPRTKIGEGSVIGAGSVVTKDIPSNVVAFGSPARVIREILPEESMLP
jgi:sugar O-acyltransferase (sialic acid O-acetyltransferase NeuD family)